MIFEVPVDHFPPLNTPTAKRSLGSQYARIIRNEMAEMCKKFQNADKEGKLASVSVNSSKKIVTQSSFGMQVNDSVAQKMSGFSKTPMRMTI